MYSNDGNISVVHSNEKILSRNDCTNLVKTFDFYKDVGITFPNTFTITNIGVEQKNMETLYNVILIDQERKILIDEKVVAKTTENAKFKAGVYAIVAELELSLDDVNVIVNQIGSVKVAQ